MPEQEQIIDEETYDKAVDWITVVTFPISVELREMAEALSKESGHEADSCLGYLVVAAAMGYGQRMSEMDQMLEGPLKELDQQVRAMEAAHALSKLRES